MKLPRIACFFAISWQPRLQTPPWDPSRPWHLELLASWGRSSSYKLDI